MSSMASPDMNAAANHASFGVVVCYSSVLSLARTSHRLSSRSGAVGYVRGVRLEYLVGWLRILALSQKPRIHYLGASCDVILRGDAQDEVFFDDVDRAIFCLQTHRNSEIRNRISLMQQ